MLSSLLFRAVSMLSKFLFLTIATKSLPAKEVASFGSASALILLATYVLGLDLYIATSRSIHSENRDFDRLFSNQLVLGGSLAVVFCAGYLALPRSSISISPLLFLPLVITEFVAQEMYRLMISYGDYIRANALFFIKSSLWALFCTLAIHYDEIATITQVVFIWLISTVIALAYGWRNLRVKFNTFTFHPSAPLFLRSMKRNAYIFASSLALITLGTVDKIFLGFVSDKQAAASYIFFASLAGACMTLIYSSVVNPNYSKITAARGNPILVREAIKSISLGVAVLLLLAGTALYFALPMLLDLIGKDYLEYHLDLFAILLVNVVLSAASLVPHFTLLAYERDREIAIASLIGTFACVGIMYPMYLLLGVLGLAMSVTVGLICMLCIKLLYMRSWTNSKSSVLTDSESMGV